MGSQHERQEAQIPFLGFDNTIIHCSCYIFVAQKCRAVAFPGCAPHAALVVTRVAALGYVIEQFQLFGEEIGRLLHRALPYIPRLLLKIRLPLYGGEMVFVARKKAWQS